MALREVYELTFCFGMLRGDIVAIYDAKTGKKPLGPKRVREIREKTGASPNVPVFEVHILRGVARKHLKASPRLVWIIVIRKWHPLLTALQEPHQA